MVKPKLVVLSGAGMSAESGIQTFRDAGGLWEGHDIQTVASPQGWINNNDIVLDFYNTRRRQLLEVSPNAGHLALLRLETAYDVTIITQNVDDLHERAGSTRVIHLHGELRKVRSTGDPTLIYSWDGPLTNKDKCEKGYPLRPHIVWFGEEVPMMRIAETHVREAALLLVIGTSLQVYPAAGLIFQSVLAREKYYIDPNPASIPVVAEQEFTILQETAVIGVPRLIEMLLKRTGGIS